MRLLVHESIYWIGINADDENDRKWLNMSEMSAKGEIGHP